METERDQTLEEGEEPKPIDEIVGGVLSEYSRSSKFLETMGFRSAGSQSASTSTSSARIRELEETIQMQALQIENGHRNEQELRATITSQQEEMLELKQKVEEANESNKRNEEQMAILKQKQETTDSLLLRLLSKSSIN
jgi:predicted RNase H-like nuclease (RuvC/YqgF family)